MEEEEPPDYYFKNIKIAQIVFAGLLIAILFLMISLCFGSERIFLEPRLRIYDPPDIVISHNSLMPIARHYDIKDTVSDEVYSVIYCESRWTYGVWGDLELEYPAYGVCQFQERTFNWLKEEAGYYHFNWKNDEQQIVLMNWAFENGYQKLWSCY